MLFFRKKIAVAPLPPPPQPAAMVPMIKEWIQLTDAQRIALAPPVEPPKPAEPQTDEPAAASEDRFPGRIIPFHIHQAERRASEPGEAIL